MSDEKVEEILKILVLGCYMLTDECNPVLVDRNKTAEDVNARQERAISKYQGRVSRSGAIESNLFHSVIEKMLHSIVDITTFKGD